MKSNKLNIIIICASIIFLFLYVIFVDGIENIVNAIKNLNPYLIIIALSVMIIYWLLEALILNIIVKKCNKTQKFKSTFKTSMIGQFFNCITPFASGGQPIQAYHMTKTGIPLGTASSCLLAKFIVYQIVFTIIAFITIFFSYSYFENKIKSFTILIIVGFIINIFVVIILIGIGYFNKITTKIAKSILIFLNKIKLIKNYDKISNYMDKELYSFYISFKTFKNYKVQIINMSILSAIQIIIYFTIPYIIYISLGLSESKLIYMIIGNIFVSLVSAFIPMPGAIGGAEISFFIVFKIFFPENLIPISILIWRLITFYLPIIVGMFFTLGINKNKIDEMIRLGK